MTVSFLQDIACVLSFRMCNIVTATLSGLETGKQSPIYHLLQFTPKVLYCMRNYIFTFLKNNVSGVFSDKTRPCDARPLSGSSKEHIPSKCLIQCQSQWDSFQAFYCMPAKNSDCLDKKSIPFINKSFEVSFMSGTNYLASYRMWVDDKQEFDKEKGKSF